MSFDPIRLDLRAKNRSCSPMEYAAAVEITRRPVAKATKAAVALAVLLALGALFMWRVQL